MHDGVLHKKWEAPNLKSFLQVIVSQRLCRRVLEKAHDASGTFWLTLWLTLKKIRKRFYWATCKRNGGELVQVL